MVAKAVRMAYKSALLTPPEKQITSIRKHALNNCPKAVCLWAFAWIMALVSSAKICLFSSLKGQDFFDGPSKSLVIEQHIVQNEKNNDCVNYQRIKACPQYLHDVGPYFSYLEGR